MVLDSAKYKTITISVTAKEFLDTLKIHKREPYYELLDRILFESDSPIRK